MRLGEMQARLRQVAPRARVTEHVDRLQPGELRPRWVAQVWLEGEVVGRGRAPQVGDALEYAVSAALDLLEPSRDDVRTRVTQGLVDLALGT